MPKRTDRQVGIIADTVRGALRRAVHDREELRFHVLRDVWSVTKRFASARIQNLELRELPGVHDAIIEGYIDDPNRRVLAAICQSVRAESFFEIGTNRGRTAWTIARNNPGCRVLTLDLPDRDSVNSLALETNRSDRDFFAGQWDRGTAYRGTPEEARITTLTGDSAHFDFSPYTGKIDVVFVDGAHSYAYVKSDSEHALRMMRPGGVVAWDDYPAIPGVYGYLNELASSLDRPLYHIYGTRLVIYTEADIVTRLPAGAQGRLLAA